MRAAGSNLLTTTQILSRQAATIATRRVWLPRVIYEALPFVYITTGFSAFFGTLYVPEWYWIVPYYFLFACGCIHAGLYVWIRRYVARHVPPGNDQAQKA